MNLKILGCSGGIGGNLRTTALLLDHDVLIDAGTGVGDLSLAEMSLIDHVFVTHAHLDHIACLPLLVDSVGFMRDKPIVIHACAQTLEALRKHVFNWSIWPDFTDIPCAHQPLLRFEIMEAGHSVEIGGRSISALPVNHVVPALGYCIDSGQGSLVFSGDTTSCDALWEAVNRIRNLQYLIVETAFSNAEQELAVLSKHLCPTLLATELQKLTGTPRVYITHLKPGEIELTMQEISECVRNFSPKMLQNGQVFEF